MHHVTCNFPLCPRRCWLAMTGDSGLCTFRNILVKTAQHSTSYYTERASYISHESPTTPDIVIMMLEKQMKNEPCLPQPVFLAGATHDSLFRTSCGLTAQDVSSHLYSLPESAEMRTRSVCCSVDVFPPEITNIGQTSSPCDALAIQSHLHGHPGCCQHLLTAQC